MDYTILLSSQDRKDIDAIIRLLDDESPVVQESIDLKLRQMGEGGIEYLANQLETINADQRGPLEGRLRELRYNQIEKSIQDYCHPDLEEIDLEGCMLELARLTYPELDVNSYRSRLDTLAQNFRDRVPFPTQPLECVRALAQFLGQEQGFRGNTADYYNPDNSYINKVLDSKLGIPITISAIYLLVSRRLNWPIRGVGTPGHFLCKWHDNEQEIFLDPFHGGHILSREECVAMLGHMGFDHIDQYLKGVTGREMFARMINNLISIYEKLHEHERAERLTDLLYLIGLWNSSDSSY